MVPLGFDLLRIQRREVHHNPVLPRGLGFLSGLTQGFHQPRPVHRGFPNCFGFAMASDLGIYGFFTFGCHEPRKRRIDGRDVHDQALAIFGSGF